MAFGVKSSRESINAFQRKVVSRNSYMYLLLGFSARARLAVLSIFGPSACPKEWFAKQVKKPNPRNFSSGFDGYFVTSQSNKTPEIQDTKRTEEPKY